MKIACSCIALIIPSIAIATDLEVRLKVEKFASIELWRAGQQLSHVRTIPGNGSGIYKFGNLPEGSYRCVVLVAASSGAWAADRLFATDIAVKGRRITKHVSIPHQKLTLKLTFPGDGVPRIGRSIPRLVQVLKLLDGVEDPTYVRYSYLRRENPPDYNCLLLAAFPGKYRVVELEPIRGVTAVAGVPVTRRAREGEFEIGPVELQRGEISIAMMPIRK